MSKILCIGILVVDVITKPVNSVPEKGKLSLVEQISLHTGGCAANAAIDLAKLGEEVGIIGLVGWDGFGDFLITTMKKEGVDIAGMKTTDKASTSASVVLSGSDGERSFLHALGANAVFAEEHVEEELIKDADIIFIAGSLLMPGFDGLPAARVLKKAKALGKYTVLDTAWDSTGAWMSKIEPCLPYVDLFVPSIEEAEMLSGKEEPREIAAVFLEKGTKNVVLKLGVKGCYIKNKEEEHWIDAFKVHAVDTNGAGDSFVAGFMTSLAHGWELKKCGQFANAVGAHCVMKMGASEGIKSREKILNFMKERGIDFETGTI